MWIKKIQELEKVQKVVFFHTSCKLLSIQYLLYPGLHLYTSGNVFVNWSRSRALETPKK